MNENDEREAFPTLPFAVFDEFGESCEDRVREHFRTALEAQPAAPVAVVTSVNGSGEQAVRVKWINGFPQIGDRLYTRAALANQRAEAETLAKLGWQAIECPVCGSSAQAFPRSANQRAVLQEWRDMLEALVDVYQDGQLPYDNRSYVSGTFAQLMEEAKAALAAAPAQPEQQGSSEREGWGKPSSLLAMMVAKIKRGELPVNDIGPMLVGIASQVAELESAQQPERAALKPLTYKNQPDNLGAWALGSACSKASQASAGDYIDRGLVLLRELQAEGFGVVRIGLPQQGGCA